MRPSEALARHGNAIRDIALAHRALGVAVFGSAARGDDTEKSDLDLLLQPAPDMTLFDIGAIRGELRALLGVEVDVVTPGALPAPLRDRIMAGARHL
ncbi:MAG: nucleotidyltransferase family protein [Alphaproteobacteria bacterium]|nr:nucleotidyltransferase family protein [Alphaproteobacteria bacterium]